MVEGLLNINVYNNKFMHLMAEQNSLFVGEVLRSIQDAEKLTLYLTKNKDNLTPLHIAHQNVTASEVPTFVKSLSSSSDKLVLAKTLVMFFWR